MCRNIRKLRRSDGVPSDDELRDAALQFIRKISGYRAPSRANEKAFERAVAGVTRVSRKMFDELVVTRPAGAGK
jgi:hypothetical protein